MKLDNPRFIIEGLTRNGLDNVWESVAYCNDAVVAEAILEAADNFLKYEHLEVSERQQDGSYETIGLRKLESYK